MNVTKNLFLLSKDIFRQSLKCYSEKMNLETCKRKEEVIFSAVDRKYYRSYGITWAWSIYKNNMHAHLHVINPKKRDIKSLERLAQNMYGHLSFTTGDIDYDLPKDRCYFASFRFLFIKNLSKIYKKIIVIDIDSLVRKKINFPNEDFGFYIRKSLNTIDPWYQDSSKIAAGIFFINNENPENALLFHETYKRYLFKHFNEGNWRWMIDQRSLFETFSELKTKSPDFKFYAFNKTELSWSFDAAALIWTGKGERKFKNKKYLKEFRKQKKEYWQKVYKRWFEKILRFK